MKDLFFFEVLYLDLHVCEQNGLFQPKKIGCVLLTYVLHSLQTTVG
jgi:hypothetical protein